MDPIVSAYLEARRGGSHPWNAVAAVNTDRIARFDHENWLRNLGNPYPWLMEVTRYLREKGIGDIP